MRADQNDAAVFRGLISRGGSDEKETMTFKVSDAEDEKSVGDGALLLLWSVLWRINCDLRRKEICIIINSGRWY
jgi:hypothetical protein